MSHRFWFLIFGWNSVADISICVCGLILRKSWVRWDTSLAICFTHPSNATVQCLRRRPSWRVRFPYWPPSWRIAHQHRVRLPDAKSPTTSRWIPGWLVFAMVWRRLMGVRPLPLRAAVAAAVTFCSTTITLRLISNRLWPPPRHPPCCCHQFTMTDSSTSSTGAKTQLTSKADSWERYNKLTKDKEKMCQLTLGKVVGVVEELWGFLFGLNLGTKAKKKLW